MRRRTRLGWLLPVVILAGSSAVGFAADSCAGSRDLKLTNGRIVTMDSKDTIVTEGDHPERALRRRGPRWGTSS